MFDFMRLFFFLIQCFLCTYRNNVHPVCGNCDVSLHPSQLVSCHPDPNAADTAHSRLHVWSVNSLFSPKRFPLFSFNSKFLTLFLHFFSPETCVFAFLGLSIFSFPHNFEISFVIWCIVSALAFKKKKSYLNVDVDFTQFLDVSVYSCRCSSHRRSWFFLAEQ